MKMKFENIIRFGVLSAAICGVSSCTDSDLGDVLGLQSENVINVGGIETEDMQVVTRATPQDADKVDWLVAPLKAGLDITYGNIIVNSSNREEQVNQDVAILKLTDNTTTPATYTFKYRADRTAEVGSENDAIWHNNGRHYFQGVHVPGRIRYTSDISDVEAESKAPGLDADQHDDAAPVNNEAGLGNYTLLAHYLGMPANWRVTATISRIKLPFRHRLARVVAFVLIDPILNTYLKGYYEKNADGSLKLDDKGKPIPTKNPVTTSIRFNNVQVLQGVKDVQGPDGHHTLTPKWKRARKVIPHFEGEMGSYSYRENKSLADDFILYTKTDANNEVADVYPTTTSPNWQTIHAASSHNGYKAVNYGKVPVYDIIVRPTYTDQDHVMYDEENYATKKAELASAKNYIDFEIALENGLNYEKRFEFDLDANYQTVVYLRIGREQVDYDDAGSELWIESKNSDNWFGVDNENGNTLSKAGSSWQRAYRSKTITETDWNNGVTDGDFYHSTAESVGQYLGSTGKWTELLLQACEGGAHHGDYFVLDHDIEINAQDIPADFVFTGHLDAQDHTITLTGTGEDTYEETTNYDLAQTTTLYNKVDGNYVEFVKPDLYICEEVAQAKPTTRASIPAGEGMMTKVVVTLSEVMRNTEKYYKKEGDGRFTEWNPRSWAFYTHRISAGSLFCGLNGTYTTRQETAANPYAEGFVWEANVHKETNKSTVWVPTMGYRAEVLNAIISGGTLFPVELPHTTVSGNVQNCFLLDGEGKKITAVTNTPNIPQYK